MLDLIGAQILSSAGSLVFLILAAHGMDLSEYGLLGIVLATAFSGAGILRALTSDVYVPRSRSQRYVPWRDAVRSSASIWLIAAGAGTAVLWATSSLDWAEVALVYVGIFAFLIYQTSRSVLLAKNQTRLVSIAEATWLVTSIVSAIILLRTECDSAAIWFSFYSVTAVLSFALVAIRRVRWRSLLPGVKFLAKEWRLTRFYAIDFLLGAGMTQLILVTLSFVMPLAEMGQIRMTQSILGPQSFIASSSGLIGVVLLSRVIRDEPSKGVRLTVLNSLVASAILAGYGIAAAALPESWVAAIFGPNAAVATPLYWSLLFAGTCLVAVSGLTVFLRVSEAGSSILAARLWTLPLVVLPLWFGASGGATGAAIGFAILGTGTLVSTAIQLIIAQRRQPPLADSTRH